MPRTFFVGSEVQPSVYKIASEKYLGGKKTQNQHNCIAKCGEMMCSKIQVGPYNCTGSTGSTAGTEDFTSMKLLKREYSFIPVQNSPYLENIGK